MSDLGWSDRVEQIKQRMKYRDQHDNEVVLCSFCKYWRATHGEYCELCAALHGEE